VEGDEVSQEFAGRNVVVTGATGELGHAVVARLLRAGAVCHAPVRSGSRRDRLEPLGSGVRIAEGVEVADEASVSAYYAQLPALWASIHCAGGFDMAPFVDTTLGGLEKLLSGNAVSCFLCSREAAKRMLAAPAAPEGRGRIVNVTAQAAVEPLRGAGRVAYAASKAVVSTVTAAAGEELAKSGIWVNAVAPSILDTPSNRGAMPKADFATWPKVEEVAETIAFLASPWNRSTRGAVVPVYGRT
jgi:NAD(P)-dependent dehydrogenase (short-subunit alcohol dehydrogenase family)